MKVLIFGDIYGKKGRQLMARYLPDLREKYGPDFVVANSENLTNGKGPIPEHLEELRTLGVDIFTGGNHSFAQMDAIAEYMNAPDSLQLRPANFYESEAYKLPGV
jgi:calcineurin-like phosphoesterase